MKKVSKIIAKIALVAANKSLSKASDWLLFQVKEPQNLSKMLKK